MIFVENKFFYFLGYGFLLTVMLNNIESITTNTVIFLMAFPLFLIASLKVNKNRFKDVTGLTNSKTLIFFYFISMVYTFLKEGIMQLNNWYFGDKQEGKQENGIFDSQHVDNKNSEERIEQKKVKKDN